MSAQALGRATETDTGNDSCRHGWEHWFFGLPKPGTEIVRRICSDATGALNKPWSWRGWRWWSRESRPGGSRTSRKIGPSPFLPPDALVILVRKDGSVVPAAALTATGVSEDGQRELPGRQASGFQEPGTVWDGPGGLR